MEISSPGDLIHCFGVGDGWPNKERNHSSFLYRFEHSSILVDCGEPLSRTYLNSGYSYDEFDAIFLSHFHGDHFGGFLMFLQGLWLKERRKDLTIYMPADGIPVVEELIKVACLFKELMPFKLEFKPISNLESFSVGPHLVKPVRTTHLDSLKEQFQHLYPLNFDCFAFGIQTDDRYVVHSSDIGAPDDLVPLLDRPVEFMVCELAHFNPAHLFELLSEYSVDKLLLIHLPPYLWDTRDDVLERGRKICPKIDISIADEYQSYAIPSSSSRAMPIPKYAQSK